MSDAAKQMAREWLGMAADEPNAATGAENVLAFASVAALVERARVRALFDAADELSDISDGGSETSFEVRQLAAMWHERAVRGG